MSVRSMSVLIFLLFTFFSYSSLACKTPEQLIEIPSKGGILELSTGANVTLGFSNSPLSFAPGWSEDLWTLETPVTVYEDVRSLWERMNSNVPKHQAVKHADRLRLHLNSEQDMELGQSKEFELRIRAGENEVPLKIRYTKGTQSKARGGCGPTAKFVTH